MKRIIRWIKSKHFARLCKKYPVLRFANEIYMINKKSIWFLTLFSLILVLSVYYVTMPSELLLTNNSDYTSNITEEEQEVNTPTVEISESSVLVALRVEAEEQMLDELEELKTIINDTTKSVEEKNDAYEKMKSLNITRGEEEKIEKQISETYNLKSFVKVDNNQIRVVADSKDHNVELANNIMRTVFFI